MSQIPLGTFLKTEKGYFYVLSNEKRLRLITQRVLDSWSPHRVMQASESDPGVSRLRITSKMKFRNGSLLLSQSSGKMYLVSENRLRHITNPDVLEAIGASREDAVLVGKDEINLHEMGEPLN